MLAFDRAEGYRVRMLDSDVNGKAMNFSKGKCRVTFSNRGFGGCRLTFETEVRAL